MKLMVLFTFLLFFAGVCALLNAECEQRIGSGTLDKAFECREFEEPILMLSWQGQEAMLVKLRSVQPHPPLRQGQFYEVWQAPDGTVSIR